MEGSSVKPLPLSTREKEVWFLFNDHGLTGTQVGERLGITKGAVDKVLHGIRNKLEGKDPKEPRGKYGKAWSGVDKTRPDSFGNAVAELTSPDKINVAEIARQANINITGAAVAALQTRVDSGDLAPIGDAIREVKTERLSKLYGHNAERILNSITDADIDDAKLRDKAIAAAVLTDKKLLLDGKPTQRVAIEDTREIGELVKRLHEVMSYRGIEIEVNPAEPLERPILGPATPRHAGDRT